MKTHTPTFYTAEQLTAIFDYLKTNNENLYICALLVYECGLRETEIRLLKAKHFNETCTRVIMEMQNSAEKRVLNFAVPQTLHELLKVRLSDIVGSEVNIFTLTALPPKSHYFNAGWMEVKRELNLSPEQNLDTFRQTAAVNLYWQTGNIKAVQQFMGHSTTEVTEKYLKGLGCSILPEVQTA